MTEQLKEGQHVSPTHWIETVTYFPEYYINNMMKELEERETLEAWQEMLIDIGGEG